MTRPHDASAFPGAQEALEHLNRKHPDTVLFLARHAGSGPDAIDAQLVTADPDGVDIEVRHPAGSSTELLVFSAAITTVGDLRVQLDELLRAARAATPGEPVTSLEVEIGSRSSAAHDRVRRTT